MTAVWNNDGTAQTGLSATPPAFHLLGGRYAFGVNATWGGGNAVLNILMPDGTTFIAAAAAFTADGTAVYDLPPGTYQVAITTATALQFFLVRVPYRAA
jgi:hypothetical protein